MTKKLTCVYSKKILVIPGAKYIIDQETLKELKKLDSELYEKAVLNREEVEFFLRFVKMNGSLTKTVMLCTLKGETLRGQELYVTRKKGKERGGLAAQYCQGRAGKHAERALGNQSENQPNQE